MADHSPAHYAGNFSGLAANYSAYRPDYSESVLSALLGLFEKPSGELDFVDVGAGTGIWTRMVNERGIKTSTAVEPNLDMFRFSKTGADATSAAIRAARSFTSKTKVNKNKKMPKTTAL